VGEDRNKLIERPGTVMLDRSIVDPRPKKHVIGEDTVRASRWWSYDAAHLVAWSCTVLVIMLR